MSSRLTLHTGVRNKVVSDVLGTVRRMFNSQRLRRVASYSFWKPHTF